MTVPTLNELTGSPIRSQAILAIVREAMDEGQCDLATVAFKSERYGETFGEIGADEYLCAYQMVTGKMPEPITGQKPEPITGETQPITPRDPVPDEAGYKMTRDEANGHLKSLDDALHLARQERMKAEDAVRVARSALWTATAQWNGLGGGYTREQLMRDNIAANQQFKQDVKDGKVPPRQSRHVADSYFDRLGSFGRGDATSFVRRAHYKNPLTGKIEPWRGGNRGAFPASMQNAPAKIHGEK